MSTYHLRSFGCRANQADGAALAAQFEAAGFVPAAAAEADWVVLNTCTVTAAADAEARQWVRRMRREAPRARLAVTGCYAQRAPAEVAALDGVAAVLGNGDKVKLVALLAGAAAGADKLVSAARLTAVWDAPAAAPGDRVRPTLKVQEGCGNRCAYCIIPAVRGVSRSLPLGDTLRQVAAWATAGYPEIVLSGINLGQWGRDLGDGLRLPALVRAILEQTPLPRLRLSSVEPMDWSDELVARMAAGHADPQPRLARHAHIPLQSGSDTVLRRMHRRYRPWHYAARVEKLLAQVPDVALGADVMLGFPGETAAEFEETYRFIAELPFTYLHLFPYSARPGTEADLRGGDAGWEPVAHGPVAERQARLRELIREKRRRWLQRFVGRALPAVTLPGGAAPGITPALSDNYVKIALAGDWPAHRLVRARVTGADAEGVVAVCE